MSSVALGGKGGGGGRGGEGEGGGRGGGGGGDLAEDGRRVRGRGQFGGERRGFGGGKWRVGGGVGGWGSFLFFFSCQPSWFFFRVFEYRHQERLLMLTVRQRLIKENLFFVCFCFVGFSVEVGMTHLIVRSLCWTEIRSWYTS